VKPEHRFSLRRWSLVPVLFVAVLLLWRPGTFVAVISADQEGGAQAPRANPLLPPERELAMKVKGTFTFAGVGDIIIRHPTGQLAEPAFQNLLKRLRDADVAFANMEGSVIDYDTFEHPIGMGQPKTLLADLKAMGIDVMSTANNHTLDSGEPGVAETIRLLKSADIVPAGSGRNLQEARAPGFVNTPKGVVALVGVFSIAYPEFQPRYAADLEESPLPGEYLTSGASYDNGTYGGGAGLNPLHVTPIYTITAEEMAAMRKTRDAILARRTTVPGGVHLPKEPKDHLYTFGQWYKVGDKLGEITYHVNEDHERDILRSIRLGKQYSDFLVVSIHNHNNSYVYQQYGFDEGVPDFLQEFAHKAIDNGADVFIGHGVHNVRPVEIYKGKPIFYGVNEFYWQLPQRSLPPNPGGAATEADTIFRPGSEMDRLNFPENFAALLVETRFENGRLAEVRLHPADLGRDKSRSFSRRGIPMIPSPEVARQMLEKVQKISQPYGTKITIENGVGVIRMTS
jgi:poly-gamma-glutamate capsule biosynthesis protein CapA/YwtB (metallophosphatase superfamily)